MTTLDAEQTAAEPIVTHYLFSMDDAIEHLRAAALLGFGVRLSSYLEQSDDESLTEGWRLEVLAESPVRADDDEADDEPADEQDGNASGSE